MIIIYWYSISFSYWYSYSPIP